MAIDYFIYICKIQSLVVQHVIDKKKSRYII